MRDFREDLVDAMKKQEGFSIPSDDALLIAAKAIIDGGVGSLTTFKESINVAFNSEQLFDLEMLNEMLDYAITETAKKL